MYDLNKVSTLIKELINNAKSLLEEAAILISNSKFERALFLSVIAIEEMGKISMYANSVQYSDKNKKFWDLFNRYKTNHPFKIFKSSVFQSHVDLEPDIDLNELKKVSGKIHKIKMNSLYVDFKDNKIITTLNDFNFDEFKMIYEQANILLSTHLNYLNLGFYNKDFLEEIKEFYNDSRITDIQEKLFGQEINFDEYFAVLIEIAIEKIDNKFANFLITSLLISYYQTL